jgi:hypothetical protein
MGVQLGCRGVIAISIQAFSKQILHVLMDLLEKCSTGVTKPLKDESKVPIF